MQMREPVGKAKSRAGFFIVHIRMLVRGTIVQQADSAAFTPPTRNCGRHSSAPAVISPDLPDSNENVKNQYPLVLKITSANQYCSKRNSF